MSLRAMPMDLEGANEFVQRHHRHHGKVVGHKFSIGAENDGTLVGVVIVGRPVSRHRDDGLTLEITRLCTDGTKQAASFLYGHAARAAFALGFRRIETAMDACDKIIELIDMERRLGPVSTAPVDEGRVERIVKAFEGVLLDINFAIEQGILPNIMNDMIYVEARAALAAIKGVE